MGYFKNKVIADAEVLYEKLNANCIWDGDVCIDEDYTMEQCIRLTCESIKGE